ncbi:hypothetical protein COV93_04785 [Candidatus Woesearchaeota archaeon CG11_big_fil_rev_8_21_14_0_20_43_8]|nr:MAG: hypothetical protein COV93_04785 [Candidatus Woesearchaeota archaeon CG11_big_fil_rev_8_21_14_0_20_43_8]PIO08934.1 MAG: hypothetical protein COT47_00635 [Candidatus Woesearchaeota archaeon CG08_land_8_20_14_0_20_43_7]
MHKKIEIKSERRESMIDITDDVQKIVDESGVKDGLCNIFVPHATAAITLNENADPNVGADILDFLAKHIPKGTWRHDRIDGNADAHIKASIIGPSETIPISDGKLVLGTWQDIFLCCFDGPRKRDVVVSILK